jgi:hypothetical protein
MSTIGGTVLAAAAGLIFGLSRPSLARAVDPAPTTVPNPTVPTPDAAPPKPKLKSPPPRRQVSHTPTYRPPIAPAPSTRPAAAVKPTASAHTRPKPVRHKKSPAKKTTVLSTITVAPVTAVQIRHAFQRKSGRSFDLGSLLIVVGLGFAIACFTIALVPATTVKWRPAAIFVSERQVDLTVVGLALLVTAAVTLFWTRAS